jgi:hypothetical protein
VQHKKQERKAAEVRELGIYHELMGNDDGIVHLLHTPAAARNMEDNRREKKEVRKEGKIETDRTKWVHLLEHQAFLSFVFFFSTKACLLLHPTLAVLLLLLLLQRRLFSLTLPHSPSLSNTCAYIHTYIQRFILSRMCIKYSLSLTLSLSLSLTHAYTHAYTHACIYAYIHTCIYLHIRALKKGFIPFPIGSFFEK